MKISRSIQAALEFLVRDHGYRIMTVSEGIGGTVSYRSPDLWIVAEWDRIRPWLEFSSSRSFDRFDWELAGAGEVMQQLYPEAASISRVFERIRLARRVH